MKKLAFMLLPFMLLTGCNKNKLDDNKIVIGCSATPHAEILREAVPLFEEEGYKLDIKIIQDYVTPNKMLQAGDLDANYFQHVPYLTDFNESNKTELSWVVKLHFEPMGIYSKSHKDLKKENPKIAIPNDVSNGQRARDLLKAKNVTGEIIEVEAQALPSILSDVDYAVINGNYALSAGITDKCLTTEDPNSDIAITNANVIAVKTTSLKYQWVSVIKKVLTSDKIKKFINTNFGSAVKAVF